MIPVAVRQGDRISGWIPMQGNEPNRREIAASKTFLAAYGEAKVFFVNFESSVGKVIDPRRLMISIEELSV